jgi:hypothetical protein
MSIDSLSGSQRLSGWSWLRYILSVQFSVALYRVAVQLNHESRALYFCFYRSVSRANIANTNPSLLLLSIVGKN